VLHKWTVQCYWPQIQCNIQISFLFVQISKSELDLPLCEPEYAQFSGYPPTIHLTISHVPPSAHDQIEQMETDCKLKVLGLKEEVEFCLPLPNACANPVALMNSGLPSAYQSSKHLLLAVVEKLCSSKSRYIGIGECLYLTKASYPIYHLSMKGINYRNFTDFEQLLCILSDYSFEVYVILVAAPFIFIKDHIKITKTQLICLKIFLVSCPGAILFVFIMLVLS